MLKNKENQNNISSISKLILEMSSINPLANPEKLRDDFSNIRKDIIDKKQKAANTNQKTNISSKDLIDYFDKEKQTNQYTDDDLDKFKDFLIKKGDSINEIEEDELDVSNLSLHSGLNEKFWKDDKLNPVVRKGLLKIAKEYLNFLGLTDVDIKDIVFTGSLANTNYTDASDVDVHLIVDYEDILKSNGKDKDFLMDYFKTKKDEWANSYDVKVYGYPVELFVQDKDESKDWTSMYSLFDDKWVNKPDLTDKNIDKKTIKQKALKFIDEIELIEKLSQKPENNDLVLKKIEDLKDKIKKMRTHGLKSNGEMANENLIFKILRTGKFLDKLYEIKKKIIDQELTLDEWLEK